MLAADGAGNVPRIISPWRPPTEPRWAQHSAVTRVTEGDSTLYSSRVISVIPAVGEPGENRGETRGRPEGEPGRTGA